MGRVSVLCACLGLGLGVGIGCSSGDEQCADVPGGCANPASVADSGTGAGTDTDAVTDGEETGAGSNDSAATGQDGSGTSPPGDWWDCDWGSRIRIDVDTAGLTETHTDVTVLVVLDPSRFDYDQTAAEGADLRFVADDTLLGAETERWVSGGTSFAWVKLPALESFYLYFGNPAAPPVGAPGDAWEPAYRAVWHFGDDLADSTANVPAAAAGSSASVEGKMGLGRDMAGEGDGMITTTPSALDGFLQGGGTVSLWMSPRTFGGGGFGRIIDRSLGNGGQGGWSLVFRADAIPDMDLPGESMMFRRAFADQVGTWHSPQSSVVLGTWQHVAIVYDEASAAAVPAIYVDGVAVAVTEIPPLGALVDEAAVDLGIGGPPFGATRAFDGVLDEVRLADVPRTAEFIDLQVRSMRDELLAFGAIESGC